MTMYAKTLWWEKLGRAMGAGEKEEGRQQDWRLERSDSTCSRKLKCYFASDLMGSDLRAFCLGREGVGLFCCCFFVFVVLRLETSTSYMIGYCSTTEPYRSPSPSGNILGTELAGFANALKPHGK